MDISFLYYSSPRQVPIDRLPADVLRIVFQFVSLRKFSLNGMSTYFHPISAIRLSHVCHLWHDLSRDHSILWTHIHPNNVRLSTFCLGMTKQSSLHVVISPDSSECCGISREHPNSGASGIICDILPRVTWLYFMPELQDLPTLVDIIWNQATPRLRCCQFNFLLLNEQILASPLADSSEIGNAIDIMAHSPPFQDSCCGLRRVIWQQYFPPLHSLCWDNLESLTVGEGLRSMERSFTEWLSIISRSPAMSSLWINHDFQVNEVNQSLATPIVLERLHTLVLSGVSIQHVETLFDHIRFPNLCFLRLYVNKTTSDDSILLLTKLMTNSGDISSLIAHVETLTLETEGGFAKITAYSNERPASIYSLSAIFPTNVADWPTYIMKYSPQVTRLKVRCLPNKILRKSGTIVLPKVTTLEIETLSRFPSLRGFAENMTFPSLETLSIRPLIFPPAQQDLEYIGTMLRHSKSPKIVTCQSPQRFDDSYPSLVQFCSDFNIDLELRP